MGDTGTMNNITSITSRKGIIPCNDKDLYAFITDMRNFSSIIPEGVINGWDASEDKCSFKVEKLGKVNVDLKEALPFTLVSYDASTFITGNVSASINIMNISNEQSEITLTVNAYLNPFVKMMIGDAAEKYLDDLITAIESYDGYSKLRRGTQSP